MPLIAELHMRYAIQCDGCQEHFEDPEYENRWWFDAAAVTDWALGADWTREGAGIEERWHCPDCPPLGEDMGVPPGQENLGV